MERSAEPRTGGGNGVVDESETGNGFGRGSESGNARIEGGRRPPEHHELRLWGRLCHAQSSGWK
jgi:hypothetical protein